MTEEWRPCLGGFYSVSNTGRVMRVKSAPGTKVGRVLKPGNAGTGYLMIHASIGGKLRHCYVHRLVAGAFIGPCAEGMSVNHLNGNKKDNRAENLEYATRHRQMQHARALGLDSRTLLTPAAVLEIRATEKKKGYIIALAAKLGVRRSVVQHVLTGHSWSHITEPV